MSLTISMTSFHQMFSLALVLLAAAQVSSANNYDYEVVVGYAVVGVDIIAGPGAGTSDYSKANFTSVIVFDNLLTETPDPKSKFLGYIRGTGTFTGKADPKVLAVISIELSDQSGSLTSIGSVDPAPKGVLQIVGGAGDYLFAKGFVELNASNGIIKVTIKYKKASKSDLLKWY